MTTPPLTVLMTFHNDAPFIAEAVDSILEQTYGDFEFVMVNDASTDGSRDIVARYGDPRIRLIDNPANLGLGRSLNRGLEAARAPLVARLDANDVARTDRLEKQFRFLAEHPEFAVLGGQYEAIDVTGRRLRRAEFPRPVTELGVRWYLLFEAPFIHSTVMFRKAAFDAVGGYNPEFRWAPSEDSELWSRMAAAGYRMINLPDVLVSLRHDPTSITYDVTRPHRAGFVERLGLFFGTNMRRILALDDAQEWGTLLAAFYIDLAPVEDAAVRRYVEAVEAIERRFVEIHPEAVGNDDVRKGKARLLARALFQKTPHIRRSSMRVFFHVLRAHGPTARRQLPKLGAVTLLGPRAWKAWHWLRSRRGA